MGADGFTSEPFASLVVAGCGRSPLRRDRHHPCRHAIADTAEQETIAHTSALPPLRYRRLSGSRRADLTPFHSEIREAWRTLTGR
jgi:hypothetical protein